MAVADLDPSTDFLGPEAEEMAEFGVTQVPVDCFHYKDFRYTHLVDALAEAKRDQTSERLRRRV